MATKNAAGVNRYRSNLIDQSSQEDYESGPKTIVSTTTRRMKVKNELNSQNTIKASSTVVTDKSPGDYVNQVTINVQEGEDIGRESSYGSSAQGISQTEKSVAMHGGIRHNS